MKFANIDDIRVGSKLVADGGFTCIAEGAVLTVEVDPESDEPFVPCDCGRHMLDGQIDDERGILVGLSHAEPTS